MHCPNTGAMLGCSEAGSTVYYSTSTNPARKYPNSLEIVQTPEGHHVYVNTSRVNKVVGEALLENRVPELACFSEWRSEIQIPGERGRFDFGIDDRAYVEVKSVTYLVERRGLFPDAVSSRATKHAIELERMVNNNARGVLFFCAPHTGIDEVTIARGIDPTYYQAVKSAIRAGVEVLAYVASVSPYEVKVAHRVPFSLG